MAGIDELSKIIFGDAPYSQERLRAVDRLMERPEKRTFAVLVRAMQSEDLGVRERAAQVFGRLVGAVLASASGRDIEFAETWRELLGAAREALAGAAQAPVEETPKVTVRPQRFEHPAAQRCALTGQPLPRPEQLEGPATVILTGPLTVPIPALSEAVARACGVPPIDVRNSLFQTHNIVRRDVPARQVPALLEELAQAGQPAVAIEWRHCLPPPQAEKALQFRLTDQGFEAEVQLPKGTELVRAAWDAVFLLCGVRMLRQTTKTVKVEHSRLFRRVRVDRTVPTEEEVFLLDILPREPWRRIRLGEPLPDLSALGVGIVGGGTNVDARAAASELRGKGVRVLMNEGVRLLATLGADLEPVTFSGKHHIEHYEIGLIQLARFGLLREGGAG